MVNTLSAKADSFLEHIAHWRCYAPLARSRPGSLENIPSSVFVPIEHKATPASVHAHAQGLGHLGVARGAELACVIRGHLNYFTTGPFSLVREYCDEARPSYVGNCSGKSIVLDHPLDVQAFDSNLAVARNQIIRNFVLVLTSAVRHPSMYPGHPALGLLAVSAAFLFPGYGPLRTPKLGQLFFEIARVINLFTFGGGNEMRQTDIQSNGRQDVSHCRRFSHIGCDDQEPFVSLALDRKRLDVPFNFSVKTDSDRPDMLHPQLVTLQTDAVAVAREKNRVEAVSSFESRVTRLLACFNAPKEIGERFIEPSQSSLCTAEVNRGKPAVTLSLVLEPPGLIGIASRYLPFVVEPLTLRQGRVVEPSVSLQHDFQVHALDWRSSTGGICRP